jgi:ABC-2 type transport system ATP-binding protein
VLAVEGLTKRYGSVVALDDCTFVAERGRLLGFLGPNGAGKSTAMRAVFGLVALDAGAITWDGRPGGCGDPPHVRVHAGAAWAVPADAHR